MFLSGGASCKRTFLGLQTVLVLILLKGSVEGSVKTVKELKAADRKAGVYYGPE